MRVPLVIHESWQLPELLQIFIRCFCTEVQPNMLGSPGWEFESEEICQSPMRRGKKQPTIGWFGKFLFRISLLSLISMWKIAVGKPITGQRTNWARRTVDKCWCAQRYPAATPQTTPSSTGKPMTGVPNHIWTHTHKLSSLLNIAAVRFREISVIAVFIFCVEARMAMINHH